MSQKRLYRVLLPALVLCLAFTAVAVAAGGSASKAPKKATIKADGKLELKVNKYFKEGYHYVKGKVVIASGGTITLVDKTGEDHTFSIVKKSDAPKTVNQAGKCFEGGICGKIAQSHGFPDAGGPPANPLVNVGADGFDQPGDSVVLPGKSKNTKVKVTAKAGTRLHFMCIIHAQMQGDLLVKK
jgi:plastocyanin